jgi:uncharacterized membrane protein
MSFTNVNDLDFNVMAFILSATLILIYYGYLRTRLRNNPSYTIQAVNARARASWVEYIMKGGGGTDVLAVQTLRNSTMAATFLASTAILLMMGVLNLVLNDTGGAAAILETVHQHAEQGDLATLKLLPLLVDFFWAFFCFSLAVRLYNHVGYLINAHETGSSPHTPAFVARLLNRSGRYYSLGMRAYYFSVPLVFWQFGPWYLIGGAIGLVVVLYTVDVTPETIADKAKDELTPTQSHQLRSVSGRAG